MNWNKKNVNFVYVIIVANESFSWFGRFRLSKPF